jgi:succinoglycan biosynthesis protein ExoO
MITTSRCSSPLVQEVIIGHQARTDIVRPTVSVVMAAYNAEPFIHRAVDSVLKQRDIDLELLIVDDASTDKTANIIAIAARKDDRINLLRLDKNGGPSAARNAGFEAAKGLWIAVLDADDAYHPDRLRTLVDIADDHEADIIADNFVYFDPIRQTDSTPSLRKKPNLQRVSLLDYVSAARPFADDADLGLLKPIFRRDFLQENNVKYPASVRHGEDFEFMLSNLRAGARFFLCREHSFYKYTGRESGWSKTRIDYSGQILRARAVASEPDIAAQLHLVQALELRTLSLERLQLHGAWRERRKQAGFIKGLQMDLASPTHWRETARRIKRRLLKTPFFKNPSLK